MENFAKKCKWSFLLTAVGLFAFFSCGKLDKTENLVDLQESFVRGEAAVDITGIVTDPLTCLPLAGATVSSGSFSVETDGNGNFSIPAAAVGDSELVTVSKEGHISYVFPVNYTGLTGANWTIGLPTRQDCVWVGPNEGAWYRITVSGVEYIIDIRRGSVDAWTQVCVGPGGTAFGSGIPLAFATTGLSTETPGAEGVVFNSPIDIRYDGVAALGSKGGIGSVGEATLAAAAAAGGANGALLTGIAANLAGLIASGATPEEIGNALFGAGNFEISPSGQFVLFQPLPAALIPSAGFLTPGGLFVFPTDLGGGGVLVGDDLGSILDIIVDTGGGLPVPDHQGTGGG